jgi:hypothetical protein
MHYYPLLPAQQNQPDVKFQKCLDANWNFKSAASRLPGVQLRIDLRHAPRASEVFNRSISTSSFLFELLDQTPATAPSTSTTGEIQAAKTSLS